MASASSTGFGPSAGIGWSHRGAVLPAEAATAVCVWDMSVGLPMTKAGTILLDGPTVTLVLVVGTGWSRLHPRQLQTVLVGHFTVPQGHVQYPSGGACY